MWGEVTAGKVTVDVYTHLRSGEMQHERQQLELTDKDAMVVFDLNQGPPRRAAEAAQLAGAVKRQEAIEPRRAGPADRERLRSACAAGPSGRCSRGKRRSSAAAARSASSRSFRCCRKAR